MLRKIRVFLRNTPQQRLLAQWLFYKCHIPLVLHFQQYLVEIPIGTAFPAGVLVFMSVPSTRLLPKTKKNSMVWVRERTIQTVRPPLVGEVIANFSE
jgi:hypothetical protein